ncbi:MAG: peptidase M42 [Caldibacillus debilis]|uniref:M42 family metallopeptidase n=1 Tax=Caldibacillus debilis TaxID=301148 RepID=UPI00036E9B8C|nr:M42 family metallopeptidase [Caldibacillus debilis]MBO2481242.1 peptidase M42 [Bacillaceae bacterium]MBY6271033.1 peptidase M42 [Bacillaceae bacterium]OUM93317.1 MAG: peptidase M42 [Caldibacillus debilis]REJ16765.1 MAG: peptidase M42 [Caldibacillus debilis]
MAYTMNGKETMELIRELVRIPSPSGNTEKAIRFIEDYFKPLGVKMKRNNKGGLLVTLDGENGRKHRFLTAHVDTLGAMVKEIKSDGRLKLDLIGGFLWNAIEGEYCQIETADGKVYTGTILLHQQSVHVYKNAKDTERNQENMEVRIDEKVKSAEDVRKLGIEVGDFVSFDPRVQITESGFIKSRHLDDKASAAILMKLVETLVKNDIRLPYTTHFFFSNNEEIGYGGNSAIPEETVEYLAVDMGAIGDGQATDEYSVSICVKDATGPYHLGLRKSLVELAKQHGIDYRLDIYPHYGSDASAALFSGYDIVHGLVGPGVDASHAFERTHELAIENTQKLLFYYVQSPLAVE